MEKIFTQIINLFLANLVALMFVFFIIKVSNFLFGFSIAQEIRRNNQSASLVMMGVFIMLGLIIGLFKL